MLSPFFTTMSLLGIILGSIDQVLMFKALIEIFQLSVVLSTSANKHFLLLSNWCISHQSQHKLHARWKQDLRRW